MPEVSVDSSLILQAKKLCVNAEKEMKGTITLLNKGMNSISAGWKDQKAKEFEDIVNQCIASLKQPLDDLHRCVNVCITANPIPLRSPEVSVVNRGVIASFTSLIPHPLSFISITTVLSL